MIHGRTPWPAKNELQLINGIYGKPILYSRDINDKSKEFIKKYNIDLRPKIPWVTLVTRVKPTEEEIKDILDELYPGLEIKIDISSAEALNTAIGFALAEKYLVNKDLFLISEQLKYACIENYSMFEKGVRSGLIKFALASDIAPRCYIE